MGACLIPIGCNYHEAEHTPATVLDYWRKQHGIAAADPRPVPGCWYRLPRQPPSWPQPACTERWTAAAVTPPWPPLSAPVPKPDPSAQQAPDDMLPTGDLAEALRSDAFAGSIASKAVCQLTCGMQHSLLKTIADRIILEPCMSMPCSQGLVIRPELLGGPSKAPPVMVCCMDVQEPLEYAQGEGMLLADDMRESQYLACIPFKQVNTLLTGGHSGWPLQQLRQAPAAAMT